MRNPDAAIGAEALLGWANGRLGAQQRLSAVEFRDDLPRNAAGKIIKRALRAPYWPPPTGTATHDADERGEGHKAAGPGRVR